MSAPPPLAPLPDAALAHDAIRVSLITGFLGSGKTTLLNHLLSSPGMERTAVLINEFGEVGIDHLIVRELDEGAVLLKSGCICCTVQGELVDGLKELYMKRMAGTLPAFTRVAIETTGLADPLPIIACLMRDPLFKHAYRLEGLVTTVDSLHAEGQLGRHVEAVRQVAIADRLVITKTDLAGTVAVERLGRMLAELNPAARILTAVQGAVEPARLFDSNPLDPGSRLHDVKQWLGDADAAREHAHEPDEHGHGVVNVNRHDEHIVSSCVTLDVPVDLEAFRRWYEDFAERRADRLLRVKGLLNVRGETAPFVVHCVQATQHVPSRLHAWPDEDRRSRIVFITRDLPRSEIEASLRGHLAQWKEEALPSPKGSGAAAGKGAPAGGVWLNEVELTRIFSALARQEDRIAANALRLMLLTAASCEEARTARWKEFDLDRRVWTKPPSGTGAKGRVRRRIPLGNAAMVLLREMRDQDESGVGCIFARAGSVIPMARLERVWKAAAKAAGIETVSLETFRPVLAANLFHGLPPALTRRLLGMH